MSIIETWAYQMTQPYFFIIAALVFIGAMAMSYGSQTELQLEQS